MSIRRRTAKRTTERAAVPASVAEAPPRLDRAFVISFLELDPEVAAALNGEIPEPPVVSKAPTPADPFAFDNVEIFRARVEPAAPYVERAARVIDIAASVHPVANEDDGYERARARRPKQRKPASRRTKSRSAAAAERVAAIKEVQLKAPRARKPAEEIRSEPPAALHPAAAEILEDSEAQVLYIEPPAPVAPAPEPAPAPQPVLPQAPAQPAAFTERRNLPVQHIDHERLMLAVQSVGWKMPPATRRQWSYMNFTLPPDPKANMTPKQIKRQEWRDMIKYFRISPYKSHYREDQKNTKRLLGQARRARLDVA